MKVQLAGLVVCPSTKMTSVKVPPGAIVPWPAGACTMSVPPISWKLIGQVNVTVSLGSTAASFQPLIELLLLFTIVNTPLKPVLHWCSTE